MYYKTDRRKNKKRKYLIIAFAAVLLIALGVGIYFLFSSSSLADQVLELPGKADGVYPYSDGVICIDGQQLTCFDMQGKSLFQAILPLEGMQAHKSGNLTVIWGANVVLTLDQTGYVLCVQEMEDTVLIARAGKDQFAVITHEENQDRLQVFSPVGVAIDREIFPYRTIMAMDFFGSNLQQLWILLVDSHSTQPISYINTYTPGKSSSVTIPITGEVGYDVAIPDKRIYFMGTHHISAWENTGNLYRETSIYGWNLQDRVVMADHTPLYALSPSGGTAGNIGSVWITGTAQSQVPFLVPSGALKIALTQRRVYIITPNELYTYTHDGTQERVETLPIGVEEVLQIIPERAFVVRSGHTVSLVPIGR